MKKILVLLLSASFLVSCSNYNNSSNNECNIGEIFVDGTCVVKTSSCQIGFEVVENTCVPIEETTVCEEPYSNVDGDCIFKIEPIATYTLQELQSDYNYYIYLILNDSAFTFAEREGFIELSNSYYKYIYDGMPEIEFYRILSKLMSYINCDHSTVSLSDSHEYIFGSKKTFLPIDVEYKDGRLYVVADSRITGIPLGSEILEINNDSVKNIIKDIYTMLTSDGENETLKKMKINDSFYYYYTLLYNISDEFDITYIDPVTFDEVDITIKGVKKTLSDFYIENYNYGKFYDYQIEENYVYLRVPNFNTLTLDVEYYETYFANFFEVVNELEVENLIIDVRHNNGGDADASNILLSYLAHSPFQYFSDDTAGFYPNLQVDTEPKENRYLGEVYVMSDGGCLSNCGHFLSLFKHNDMGYIIGEESGAGYISTSASVDGTLSYTGIKFRISIIEWKTAVPDTHIYNGTIPDFYHYPSIAEIINKTDSTLLYILELINNGT